MERCEAEKRPLCGAAEGGKALRYFLAQTTFGAVFTYLTSGVFLSGLAILMGAGDVLVSYLSIIANVCGVLILAFAPLMERFTSRKRLAIGLTALTKLVTLFLAAIPALLPPGLRLAVFVPAAALAFTLQAQTTVAVNQWMLGFLEMGGSGRYISLRQTLTLAVTVVLSIICGQWVDRMGGTYGAFALLFAVAGAAGAVELVLLARTPDAAAEKPAGGRRSLRDTVKIPLGDRRFMRFVRYVVTFYLLLYISDSYTMVYMMRYLALPYGTVTALYMLISLPQVVLLGVWGRLSDRKGHAFALRASIWLFAGETVFLSLASPQSWTVCIPLAFLVSSAANAGFAVAVFNRRYELMPRENRIVYDNFYTAAVGVGFMLGPMLGGAAKSVIGTWSGTAADSGGIRVLYLISTAGILLLQFAAGRGGRENRNRP